MKNEDQIAAEAADKLSRPPRCSCAGSQFSERGKRERSKRKAIIKSAIEKAHQEVIEECAAEIRRLEDIILHEFVDETSLKTFQQNVGLRRAINKLIACAKTLLSDVEPAYDDDLSKWKSRTELLSALEVATQLVTYESRAAHASEQRAEPWKISGNGLNIFQGNRLLCTCQNTVQALQTVDAHEAAIEKAYELGRQDEAILSRAAHASEQGADAAQAAGAAQQAWDQNLIDQNGKTPLTAIIQSAIGKAFDEGWNKRDLIAKHLESRAAHASGQGANFWRLFHKAWGNAREGNYDKSVWLELQALSRHASDAERCCSEGGTIDCQIHPKKTTPNKKGR